MLVSQVSQSLRRNDAYQVDLIRKVPHFTPSELFSERSLSSHYSPELHGRITLWTYTLKFINQWFQARKRNTMNRSHVFLTSIVVVLVSILFMYSGFLLALKISDKESNTMLNSELVSHNMEQVSYVPEFDPFSPYVTAPTVREHQVAQKNQPQFQAQKMHPQRVSHAVDAEHKPVMRQNMANRGMMNNSTHQNNRFAGAPVKMQYAPNAQVMYIPASSAQTKTPMGNVPRPRGSSRNNVPPQSAPNRIFQTNQRHSPSMAPRPQQRRKINRPQRNQSQSNRNIQYNQPKRSRSNLNTLPKNSPLPQNFVPPVLQ